MDFHTLNFWAILVAALSAFSSGVFRCHCNDMGGGRSGRGDVLPAASNFRATSFIFGENGDRCLVNKLIRFGSDASLWYFASRAQARRARGHRLRGRRGAG